MTNEGPVDVLIAVHNDPPIHITAQTRIVSARVEMVRLSDFPESNIHVLSDPSEDVDVDHYAPMFILERSIPSTLETSLHAYSIAAEVCQYLSSQQDPLLLEDEKLLSMVVTMTTEGLHTRENYHRKVKPLMKENEVLRGLLNLSKHEAIDPIAVRRSLRTKAEEPPPQQPAEEVLVGDPMGLHSPLQWAMETEAARNARTKYTAYRTAEVGTRQLDSVTQSQLVTRLHDQSVDNRRRRLQECDDKIVRDIGGYERRVLTVEEQVELGSRLHDRQNIHSKQVREDLNKTYCAPLFPARSLSPVQVKESNTRIYNEPVERKQRNMNKLLKEYVYDIQEKYACRKLQPEQLKELAQRLTKK